MHWISVKLKVFEIHHERSVLWAKAIKSLINQKIMKLFNIQIFFKERMMHKAELTKKITLKNFLKVTFYSDYDLILVGVSGTVISVKTAHSCSFC